MTRLECRPIQQKAVGFIPSQGAHLECGFDSRLGSLRDAANQCFSLSFSLPLSLKSVNMFSGEDLKVKIKTNNSQNIIILSKYDILTHSGLSYLQYQDVFNYPIVFLIIVYSNKNLKKGHIFHLVYVS